MSLVSNAVTVTVTAQAQTTPTWLQGKNLLTWYQIPNTAMNAATLITSPFTAWSAMPNPGGVQAAIMSYSAGALKSSGSEYFMFGGGHSDYAGNEVLTLRMADNAPAWKVRRVPTTPTATDVGRYSDGRPTSRHSGCFIQYINARDRMFVFPGGSVWGSGPVSFNIMEAFNPTSNDWDHIAGIDYATPPNKSGVNPAVCKDTSENVYYFNDEAGQVLYKWTQATAAWTTLNAFYDMSGYNGWTTVYDPVRGVLVPINPNSPGTIHPTTGVKTAFTWTGTNTPSLSTGSCWCNETQSILYMNASDRVVREAKPSGSNMNVTDLALSVPTGLPGLTYGFAAGVGVYTRFWYDPTLKIVGYIPDINTNVWYFRTG